MIRIAEALYCVLTKSFDTTPAQTATTRVIPIIATMFLTKTFQSSPRVTPSSAYSFLVFSSICFSVFVFSRRIKTLFLQRFKKNRKSLAFNRYEYFTIFSRDIQPFLTQNGKLLRRVFFACRLRVSQFDF